MDTTNVICICIELLLFLIDFKLSIHFHEIETKLTQLQKEQTK